ncbi:DUF4349 domain-containing protein [Paenisporosarcina quisquiliarum]|uniref:DUF4349 domain-containing protein n=1 Tax=Paenisporosarcina quisquiliarum TaxID=365346 RepID=A0A9X3LI96_9BACL|nr:DUF4349 domain-containing protein [Paenisporosarcina quisquiliarum]MCZ8537604.1 DUF4349 domain-containing protein [Paenisporosarcina quisquiliarum]
MRKKILFILLFSLLVLLGACSASEMDTESSEDKAMAPEMEASNEVGTESEELANETSSDESQKAAPVVSVQRMIIHKAILSVNVKELDKAQSNIQKKVEQYGGYIVESNVYQEDDQTSSGTMIVRVPEENFEKFLLEAEGEAAKVLERNVTGQDVTEQYVDLESRVRSKRAVEERLLDFMSKAQKTEDLLKISEDLAQVQEEIEVMVGKMKYLENQTSFSTIEISMYENRVVVPEIDSKELNTWEKTKKQFATSTNSLLSAASAFIVFFIGNLPVLFILSLIGFGVYWFIRRRLNEQKKG